MMEASWALPQRRTLSPAALQERSWRSAHRSRYNYAWSVLRHDFIQSGIGYLSRLYEVKFEREKLQYIVAIEEGRGK